MGKPFMVKDATGIILRLLVSLAVFAIVGCGSGGDTPQAVNQQPKLDSLYLGGYVGYAPIDKEIAGKVYSVFRVETTRQSEWLFSFDPISRNVAIAESCSIEYWAINGKPVDSNAELVIGGSERHKCYVVW
jgi:hypothetical protein